MIRHLRIHRTNHGNVVDMGGRPGENLTDFDTRLTVTAKLKRRRKCGPGLTFGQQIISQRLPGVFAQQRLMVERVNVGRTTIQKEVYDAFGLRQKGRRPIIQWTSFHRVQSTVCIQHMGQTERANTQRRTLQH